MVVVCDVEDCGQEAKYTQHQTIIESSYSRGGVREDGSFDLCETHADIIIALINTKFDKDEIAMRLGDPEK